MNRCIPQTIQTIRAMDNFANWLSWKMSESDTTPAELAQAIGLDRKTIAGYLRRERYPKLDVLVMIYAYFGEDWIQIPFYKVL